MGAGARARAGDGRVTAQRGEAAGAPAGAATLQVRHAARGDLPAVARIERASFSDPWPAASFEELLGRPDVVFVVAERGAQEVAGYAIVYVAADGGDLANIAVDAAVRGKGVGRRVLRAVREEVRRRGVRVLFLEVRESNAGARRLYEGEGFVEVGRRSRYYVRPVEDALILRLEPV